MFSHDAITNIMNHTIYIYFLKIIFFYLIIAINIKLIIKIEQLLIIANMFYFNLAYCLK